MDIRNKLKKYGAAFLIGCSLFPVSCELPNMGGPKEDAVVLRVDYECAKEKVGSYWDIINEYLKGEEQPHGFSGAINKGDLLIQKYSKKFGSPIENPFAHSGPIYLPDINGDGKFSDNLMECGEIIKPDKTGG